MASETLPTLWCYIFGASLCDGVSQKIRTLLLLIYKAIIYGTCNVLSGLKKIYIVLMSFAVYILRMENEIEGAKDSV